MRKVGPLVLSVGLLTAAEPVRANGRFPEALDVWATDSPDGTVVAMDTTFGVLLRRGAREPFRWMCEAELFRPLSPTGDVDVALAMAPDARVFFGFAGGLHSSRDGCTVDRAEAVAGQRTIDLTAAPDGSIWGLVEAAGGRYTLVRAAPHTSAVTTVGETLSSASYTNLDVAPSDATRLYLSGMDRAGPVVLRSTDGGAHGVRAGAAGLDATADGAYVSGIDPTDAAVVYVRVRLAEATALYRSSDAGEHFARVATTRSPMLGFALSDDGRTVWVGSRDGLLRSDDRGLHFSPLDARLGDAPLGGVSCLRVRAGSLWACSDWVRTGVALARSSDGVSFDPVMRFADVAGAFSCAPELTGPMVCGWQWPAQRSRIERATEDAGPVLSPEDASVREDVAPGVDGSVERTPPVSSRTPQCGCEAGPTTRGGLGYAALWALSRGRSRRRRAFRPRRCSPESSGCHRA